MSSQHLCGWSGTEIEGVGESMGDVTANCEGESSCPLGAVFMTTSH